MQPIQLFKLASEQAQWLSVRHTVVAGNIANANTSGYVAKDVAPFNAVLESAGSKMAATHPGHINEANVRGSTQSTEINGISVHPSGNTVSLPNELSKGSEIKRQYEINAGIVKKMNNMMLAAVRK
ncbi:MULTISPECIES: flagellar basal body rod protein FlgB [unclassified Lentilitoribacter]|jgi:flagellar basal-body rod protein FlgB|uniref:flagellar basal body rod protein FlgB n=1 Tax=unclassified Lentilitoribacter TaxID=2647570 RepID=UPI0013A707F9|nr:flagellar basal body rod protein FlgB [Lentilitoribacter sp. Alg239-R112]